MTVISEAQRASSVQRMFARIAPRYDLLNHLLSFNIDRGWRRRLLEAVVPVLRDPHARVLDLCCGTGDVLVALQQQAAASLLGADFCRPMLAGAQAKLRREHLRNPLFEADALRLPFAEGSLDAITIAFGFRNLVNYRAALSEFRRVLRAGGRLAILEFSHPPNPMVRWLYGLYSRFVLPLLGGLVSGSPDAYRYLPDSIGRFPTAAVLAEMMREAGFVGVRWRHLTFGVAALHVAGVEGATIES